MSNEQKKDKLDLSLRENTLATRLKLILITQTKERGRFSLLEGLTGIPAATWRTWWMRGGTPSGSLVEAAAKNWPEFAYWLVTSTTDIRCGHDMPDMASTLAQGYVTNTPEESFARIQSIRSDFSKQYLKLTQEAVTDSEKDSVRKTINWASLRAITAKRKEEIASNFEIKLMYEQDLF